MWRVNRIGMEQVWYESELIKKIREECSEAVRTYEQEEFYEDDCDRFMGESCIAQRVLEIIEDFGGCE